ncbi:MAG: hypothetical protein ACK4V1_04830 [Burkholderiaceae bacterium]
MPALSRRAASLGTENAFVVLAEVDRLIRSGVDVVSFRTTGRGASPTGTLPRRFGGARRTPSRSNKTNSPARIMAKTMLSLPNSPWNPTGGLLGRCDPGARLPHAAGVAHIADFIRKATR